MQRRDMSKKPDPKPDPAPLDLPPVDPDELERALRLAVDTRKLAGGWKRKGQEGEPPKPSDG